MLPGLDALEPPQAGAAVAIGTFDGVHVGHQALIGAAIDAAAALGCSSAVVSWDRHPNQTLRSDKTPPLLSSIERKNELIAETGVDLLALLAFDAELSSWPPERFVSDVLIKGLGVRSVHVGSDWRFGHKAAGDVALLAQLGAELGFTVEPLDLTMVDSEPVSSSRVRAAVAAGDLGLATRLLGRPFDLDGEVRHGADRGASLGFPTANVPIPVAGAHPPRGVYAGRARAGEAWHPAAINIGVNPTFGGDPDSTPLVIEAFLLDFSGDLYGQSVRLEFWQRLRDEEHFDSVEALVARIESDVTTTRHLISDSK